MHRTSSTPRTVQARHRRSRQRGVALVLVLWVSVLITVLLASFSLSARVEALQGRNLLDSTRARYAAEAGLHRAAYELRGNNPDTRWVADGRVYPFEFEGAEIEVQLYDETGKVDLNVTDPLLLAALFEIVGKLQKPAAEALAAAVVDWRDPDDLLTLNGAEADQYKSEGRKYKPRNAPFETVSELQQVLGMSFELYRELEPLLTIYSGRAQPNPAFAAPEVLQILPGMNPDLVQLFVRQREAIAPGPAGAAGAGLALPDGTPVVAQGGGLTYTIRSRAQLPGGAKTSLEATIRLGASMVARRPFRIVRWRDGESR
ncbi:MAG: general secretion pathway protein GspK [Xanthomonadales bacterium]|nr:general secretion pathway protein GspK [Xanthomonadales bacterium]